MANQRTEPKNAGEMNNDVDELNKKKKKQNNSNGF